MSPWLVAIGAGIAFALLQYGWRRTHRGPLGLVAAALRLGAVALVVALLLDAPAGRARPVREWAALDVSESMMRGDSALWRAALDSVARLGADSTLLFGDSARASTPTAVAGGSREAAGDSRAVARDSRSDLRPVADRALAAGHPVVVVTDGELSDADAAASLPAGSRLVVLPRAARGDAAIASVEAPRAVVAGDTVIVRVGVLSGAAGSAAGSIALRMDGRELVRTPLDALPPFGARSVEARVRIDGAPGPALLQVVLAAAGDAVARNDTFSVALDRSRSASAVFVTTTPDFDSRAAIGLLRGALAMPARGFLRVAPGVWRVDGSLAPVAETEVRAALREAPIAILHGDTSAFGAPRTATLAPYALMVPATDTSGEWYVSSAPISPLSPAYAGVGWDSLPPVITGGQAAAGAWTAMQVSEGRSGAPRALVVGTDAPRRTVTVVGSGFWRWQFRGGKSADAFAAFWGGIFDWLAGERADKRAAIPDASAFRAGERIRWRRGSAADSVVTVVLRKRNAPSRGDSLVLRFAPATSIVETPALAEGQYDVQVNGGAAILAVNPSAEWLPHRVRVKSGVVRSGAPVGAPPKLRDYSWVFALVVGMLCAEWLVRRQAGLR